MPSGNLASLYVCSKQTVIKKHILETQCKELISCSGSIQAVAIYYLPSSTVYATLNLNWHITDKVSYLASI